MAISSYVRSLRARVGNEFLLLPSVTGIVYDDRNRILLVREAGIGVWSAPGGVIEPQERPADAVTREVWEETGLLTEPVRLLAAYGGPDCGVTYANGDRSGYVMLLFECAVRGGTLRRSSDETTDAAWFGPEDLAGLPAASWVPRYLPGLFDRGPAGRFEPATWRPETP